eukprot:1786018-Prymnesium_polylepis.2
MRRCCTPLGGSAFGRLPRRASLVSRTTQTSDNTAQSIGSSSRICPVRRSVAWKAIDPSPTTAITA